MGLPSSNHRPDWCEKQYQAALAMGVGNNSSHLGSIRGRAAASWNALGLPRTCQEDWKYTDLSFLSKRKLHLSEVRAIDRSIITNFLGEGWGNRYWAELIFINGICCPELCRMPEKDSGVKVLSLAESLADIGGRQPAGSNFSSYFSSLSPYQQHPFVALNTALFQNGLILAFDEGVKISKPFHIAHITTVSDALINPRLLCLVGQDSEVLLTESYANTEGSASLSNGVAECFVERGAKLGYTKILSYDNNAVHLSNFAVKVKDQAEFDAQIFSFGGKVVRNEMDVELAGERISADLRGLTVLNDSQHVDNHICVKHCRPCSTSKQLFKGIYDDKARGVFSGTIIVEQAAQKTVAFQSNQNLLLSEDARIETRPQLKIWADDVKCSHGATVGQLDEEALFYLRSRGLLEQHARQLLVSAFANEVVASSPNLYESERVVGLIKEKLERLTQSFHGRQAFRDED